MHWQSGEKRAQHLTRTMALGSWVALWISEAPKPSNEMIQTKEVALWHIYGWVKKTQIYRWVKKTQVECLTNSPPVTTDRHSDPRPTGLCKGGFPLAHHPLSPQRASPARIWGGLFFNPCWSLPRRMSYVLPFNVRVLQNQMLHLLEFQVASTKTILFIIP